MFYPSGCAVEFKSRCSMAFIYNMFMLTVNWCTYWVSVLKMYCISWLSRWPSRAWIAALSLRKTRKMFFWLLCSFISHRSTRMSEEWSNTTKRPPLEAETEDWEDWRQMGHLCTGEQRSWHAWLIISSSLPVQGQFWPFPEHVYKIA